MAIIVPFVSITNHGEFVIVHLDIDGSSAEVRVLRQGGGCGGGSSSLIGQKCKMVEGKQPSDWTIIQDGE